jgi:hypothetical protein
MSRRALDWNDPEDKRRLVESLRVTFDDMDALVTDMLLPPRERRLGPALHAEQWADLRRKLASLIELLLPSEPCDPSGSGGAGPVD